MNDEPRHKLRELLIEHGRTLCADPRRCEALLKDYCGTSKREIFVLIAALKNRVADDLLKSSADMPQAMVMARLQQLLEDKFAMTSEAALWAVESWVYALGLVVTPSAPVASVAVVAPARLDIALTIAPSVPPPKGVDGARDKADLAKPVESAKAGAKRAAHKETAHAPKQAVTATTEGLLVNGYRDNGNGTVTDVATGLQWMRFSLGQAWRGGTCIGLAKRYQWQDAQNAVRGLNLNGGFAGHRDWRLPSKADLLSLVYCSSGRPKIWNDTGRPCEGEYKKPTIVQPAFPNTPSSEFWSGSPVANYSDSAWYVSFSCGDAYGDARYDYCMVRLVRSEA